MIGDLECVIATTSLAGTRMPSRLRAPAGVGPELAADGRVADHEVNRVRNFGGIDQPLELRVGEDVLLDVLLPQRPDHRSVGEARMNDGAADSVVNGLLTQGSRSAFEGGLGGGVGDLAGDARRR